MFRVSGSELDFYRNNEFVVRVDLNKPLHFTNFGDTNVISEPSFRILATIREVVGYITRYEIANSSHEKNYVVLNPFGQNVPVYSGEKREGDLQIDFKHIKSLEAVARRDVNKVFSR